VVPVAQVVPGEPRWPGVQREEAEALRQPGGLDQQREPRRQEGLVQEAVGRQEGLMLRRVPGQEGHRRGEEQDQDQLEGEVAHFQGR
jgi:hypothetical protein